MLFVDTRWRGDVGGIQRYANEVISRLDGTWRELATKGSPSSPMDLFLPVRMRLRPSDLVYSPGYNAGISRARQILTLHDLIHLQHPTGSGLPKRLYYDRILRPAIRRAGAVMTVSETSRRAISEWLRDPAVRVVNVGNGCSDVFASEGPSYQGLGNYFLYVGAIKTHKNFDVILRALALRPSYRLVAVTGDRTLAQERASTSGVESQVTVLSGVSDGTLASLYRGSLGLLFPSLLEGFGLPAVEALRSGKRVAYWQGCESLAEIVADAGAKVENARDPEGWAAAMDELLRQGPLPENVASEKYRWDAVASNVRQELRRDA